MFGIGLPEIFIILVIALVVLGPEKLPDLARAIGRGVGEFRKATDELKSTLNSHDDLRELKDNLSKAKDDMSDILRNPARDLGVDNITDALAQGTFFEQEEEKARAAPEKPEASEATAENDRDPGVDPLAGHDKPSDGHDA